MNRRCPVSRRSLLALVAVLWLAVAGPEQTTAAVQPGLFADSTNPGSVDHSGEPWIERQRLVTVDFAQLATNSHSGGSAGLRLNLFEDIDLTATLGSVVENPSGSRSWIGSVTGHGTGSVILVAREDVLVGSVRVPGGFFQILYLGDGAHGVYEINEALLPPEEPPSQVTLPAAPLRTAPSRGEGTDPADSYDLQVVYTPAARTGAGGTVAMENLIDLGITESNQSYSVSGIPLEVRLVHTAEIDYTESNSLVTDRNRLRDPGDGFMDEVHTMRDTWGADVTTLIVEFPGCGIAYIMNPVDPAFESFAFNVTMRSCVSPNYTFEHEIGHLQSARHDWAVDPTNNAPFTYNHGYVDPQSRWRSIMAYSNACGGCTRELFWSNPDRDHPVTGNPTGVPEGQAQAADNRKTLTMTAPTVANFRARVLIFKDGFETGSSSRWSNSSP